MTDNARTDNPTAGPAEADRADWQPRILAFLCNWCSYAGADLAGVSRIQYPPNVRVIRVPCSGRVNPMFLLRALPCVLDSSLHRRDGGLHLANRTAVETVRQR